MTCRPLRRANAFALPFAFTGALAFAGSAPAQDAPPKPPDATAAPPAGATSDRVAGFENLAPPQSLVWLGIDSVERLRADFAASPFGQILGDPANESVKKAVANFFAAISATTTQEAGVDLVDTVSLVDGRLGVAMTGDVDLAESKGSGITFAVESTAGIAELRARVDKLLDKANEAGGLVLKHESVGDVDVTLVVEKEPGPDAADVRVGVVGPVLLVDVSMGELRQRHAFEEGVAALQGEGKESLAALPAFKASGAAKAGGVKVWVDTGAILRARMETEKKKGEDARDTVLSDLSFGELGPLAARFDMNAKETRLELVQSWSGKGLLADLVRGWLAGADFSLLKLLPAEIEQALALHVDFARGMAAAEAIGKALGEAPPEAAAGGAGEDGAPAPLDPRKDFLDHLDGRVVLFGAQVEQEEAIPFPGLQKPIGLCIVLGVKSADPLRASLEKFLRSMGMHAARKKSEFQGFEVYSVPVMPLNVHYAILDDVAVISSSLAMLQDVLRRKSDPELKNLAAEAGFKREFDAMTPGASLLVWSRANPSAMVSNAASIAMPMGLLGEGDDGGGSSPAQVMKRALFELLQAFGTIDPAVVAKRLPPGTVLGLGADAQGIHLESVSR